MKYFTAPYHFSVIGLMSLLLLSSPVYARDYIIDTKGMHASIQFRIKHLGFSWLTGRFEKFDGTFSYDKRQAGNSKIQITVQTASINSNHAERDKHLRGKSTSIVKLHPKVTQ